MKKGFVEIPFEDEKLEALKYFLTSKDLNFEKEVQQIINDLYEKIVPSDVRAYIEKRPISEVKRGRKKTESKAEDVIN
jgi:hypothetical protein